MRILHIVGSFLNGGIETLLVNVANRQSQDGHEVGIIFITNRIAKELVSEIDSSVKTYYVNKPVGSKNPYFLLRLNYFYRRFCPQILHLHGSNFTNLLLGKCTGEKRFVTLHNNVIKIYYSKSVDQYIAISECVRASFVRQTGMQNCTVCYNGITLENFVTKTEYREKPQKIVCVGRVLFGVKGQDILIDALTRLKSQGYSLACDFYGTGSDYELLKHLIEKNNLQASVKALGNIPNEYLAKHLHEYDLAVQASRHEGLGISAIETMACGVPTILSAVDGFLEVSKNGQYAMLFANESAAELCDKLISAIEHYDTCIILAKDAKNYVDASFSILKMVSELDTIYTSV